MVGTMMINELGFYAVADSFESQGRRIRPLHSNILNENVRALLKPCVAGKPHNHLRETTLIYAVECYTVRNNNTSARAFKNCTCPFPVGHTTEPVERCGARESR